MSDIDALLASYRITDGSKFRLSKHEPRDTNGFDIDKAAAKAMLEEGISHMRDMQDAYKKTCCSAVMCGSGESRHNRSSVTPAITAETT